MNCQNRKETKRGGYITCLKRIEDKPSCFEKSKNENELILYHFRSEEKRVKVIQETIKQNEKNRLFVFSFNEYKKRIV